VRKTLDAEDDKELLRLKVCLYICICIYMYHTTHTTTAECRVEKQCRRCFCTSIYHFEQENLGAETLRCRR